MEVRGARLSSNPPSLRALQSGGLAGLERYVIERKIASGGMAAVYLGHARGGASSSTARRPVAIKICHPHLLDGEHREHRAEALIDEARIASRIHHPNVVATLDVVAHESSVMIVMEYVEGVTVAGLLRGPRREAGNAQSPLVPLDVALRVISDACLGLHAAHELRSEDGRRELGVVHRDVSPQNILLGVDGVAKLADFGVFKGEDRLAPSTETGDLKGKLGYVAPEVYRGEPVSRRADIYAMGVVLWELLAGRRLFDEGSHAAMMQRVLRGRVAPIASVREDIPYELDAVLARALAVDPAERYGTAAELADALLRLPAVDAAPLQTVGWHVRQAMESESGTHSTKDAGGGAAAKASAEPLTPIEYVTPVKYASTAPMAIAIPITPSTFLRGRSRRIGASLALAMTILAALGIAFALLRPATPTTTTASRKRARVASVDGATATRAPAITVRAVNIGSLPTPAAQRLKTTTAASPTHRTQPRSSPSSQKDKTYYDPEEL